MSRQEVKEAEMARKLAAYRQLIAQLPVTLRPASNQQLAQWETLFPFEQHKLIGFLGAIDSLDPATLKALMARLWALEAKMGVEHWNFSEYNDTVENAAQLARSEYYLEWRHEVQRIFETVEAKARHSAINETQRGRLIILFLPENLPVDPSTVWEQWGPHGHQIGIAGDSRKLCDMAINGQPGLKSIPDLLAQQGSYENADLWLIDADTALTGTLSLASVPAASCLSYAALKPFRDKFLADLNTIPKDMSVADQTVATLRQTDWERWCPADLARQKRLRNFVVEVFLSGNGSLIFSNSFVEWAASEALRRARPRVVVARFGMRSKPKLFTSIAVFENQEKISPLPDVDDPENSAVDAAILARYVWLSARRYPEYDRSLCLCVSEHLNAAYVIAPPGMNLGNSGDTISPEDIYRTITSWLTV